MDRVTGCNSIFRLGKELAFIFSAGPLVALALAASYVFWGMPLNGTAEHEIVSDYIFWAVGITALVSIGVYRYFSVGRLTDTLAAGVMIFWALASGIVDTFVYMICWPLGMCSLPSEMPYMAWYINRSAELVGLEATTLGWVTLFAVLTFVPAFFLARFLFRIEGV